MRKSDLHSSAWGSIPTWLTIYLSVLLWFTATINSQIEENPTEDIQINTIIVPNSEMAHFSGKVVDESAEEDGLSDVARTGNQERRPTALLAGPQIQNKQGQQSHQDANHKGCSVRGLS